MVVGEMNQLGKFVRLLLENESTYFVGCNDRFAKPTEHNWQDCACYLMFNNCSCNGIVAEVQLVHPRFLDIREKFGAHDAYDSLRFPAEVLKLKHKRQIRGLPDSQRRNH